MSGHVCGQGPGRKARRWSATDRRYQSYRWKVKTRPIVLRRDGYRCLVSGCVVRADVCDHIDAVNATTTDAEFYDMRRLRASCRAHNIARGYIGAEFEGQFGMVQRPLRPSSGLTSGSSSGVITRSYTKLPR
jgi:hypothetical protein